MCVKPRKLQAPCFNPRVRRHLGSRKLRLGSWQAPTSKKQTTNRARPPAIDPPDIIFLPPRYRARHVFFAPRDPTPGCYAAKPCSFAPDQLEPGGERVSWGELLGHVGHLGRATRWRQRNLAPSSQAGYRYRGGQRG